MEFDASTRAERISSDTEVPLPGVNASATCMSE